MKMRSALPLFGALLLVSLPLTAPGDEGGTQRLSDLRGIWNVEFNPDGSRFVVRMTDAHSTIWDTDKGTLIGDVPPEPRAVKMSVTSPDGTMVFEENEEN